jgi:hypothetical protein
MLDMLGVPFGNMHNSAQRCARHYLALGGASTYAQPGKAGE